MRWRPALVVFAALLAVSTHELTAQDSTLGNWQAEAVARLKAIYEEGAFRAETFAGDWLADSSGYTIRQRDPETEEPTLVRYDVETGERDELQRGDDTEPDPQRHLSPDGQRKIEIRGRHLFVRDLESGRRTRLTEDAGDRDVTYRRPTWSPNGKSIVFVETDESEVKLRPVLVPVDPSYPKVENHRFARVGGKIPSLRVGVVDSKGEETVWLPIDSPAEGFYLGQVEWAGNSDEVLVEKLSRYRDRREFLILNVHDQSVQRIYQESDPAWSVGSQGKNAGLIWIRGGDAFIVISEKDGWRHAFLHTRDGEELSLLTPGDYDIIDREVVDEEGGWFYFYASPNNGTQKYLYRVPLDGSGTLKRITPEDQPGTHHYDFSPNARWAFHSWSTFDRPPMVELVELPDHRVVRVLEDNQELREKLEQLISSPTEFFTLDVDGVAMDAWMIKPKDFDKSKKYPVLVYVYGEPYAQTVLDQWGTHHADFHRMIADLGFLVVSIDNRGTPAPKGAAWRRSIFGSLGPLSTNDQAAALKELGRTRPYVDLDRVAIWGWSGGGSNTLNAMFRKPELYRVGIAVVPKPQPHLYNAWFQEIYMRTREDNPDGYERSAPINFAEGLEGKLLIITGSGETNTHIQIVEGLVDRLIELGKPFDYMVYPNRDHGLRKGEGTSVHLRMLMTRYLVEHLKPGPR
jgi:dipeptidyl-peptidase-4